MSDLVKRLRRVDEYEPLGHDGWEAADRIAALEAENARLREAAVHARIAIGATLTGIGVHNDRRPDDRISGPVIDDLAAAYIALATTQEKTDAKG